ncbi:MAG: hypothetical protein PGN26_15425 [Xylophilus ampelinus]
MASTEDDIAFTPYADEADVIRIGDLEIGNRIDRVTLTGDLVLTKDREGLARAKQLQALAAKIVEALEAEANLPAQVQVTQAKTVKNPFA